MTQIHFIAPSFSDWTSLLSSSEVSFYGSSISPNRCTEFSNSPKGFVKGAATGKFSTWTCNAETVQVVKFSCVNGDSRVPLMGIIGSYVPEWVHRARGEGAAGGSRQPERLQAWVFLT